MIVLAVQQGIASLPPTSGQSITYALDPAADAYVRSERFGPTALRATETVGQDRFSVRVAMSYFEFAETLDPVAYSITFDDPMLRSGFVKLGIDAAAKVGLITIAASYGISKRAELSLNVPVVVVDTEAETVFTTRASTLGLPALEAPLSGTADRAELERALQMGLLAFRHETFNDLGLDLFNGGTHAGVGRVSIGGKVVLLRNQPVQVAFAPEFFFPSPNEEEFAGSDSAAILPRLVVAVPVAHFLKLRLDGGYDYDFDEDALRRVVWSAGASVALRSASFDLGIGGSKFNQGIRWTPSAATFRTTSFGSGGFRALGDNQLGDTFIDGLAGMKVRLSDQFVLSAAVNVPLNDAGLRPAALGTLAIEYYPF